MEYITQAISGKNLLRYIVVITAISLIGLGNAKANVWYENGRGVAGVRGGYANGHPLYVCRARHNNKLYSGKSWDNRCYISGIGMKTKFEYLAQHNLDSAVYVWALNGENNAFEKYIENDFRRVGVAAMQRIYICQAIHSD